MSQLVRVAGIEPASPVWKTGIIAVIRHPLTLVIIAKSYATIILIGMDDLQNAKRLADIADEITKKHYLSARLEVNTKPDDTPVTEADLGVEKALSAIVH